MMVTHKNHHRCRFTVRFNKFAFLEQKYERCVSGKKTEQLFVMFYINVI